MSERNIVMMDECFWINATQWCALQKKQKKTPQKHPKTECWRRNRCLARKRLKMANLAEPLQTGHSQPATGHKAHRLPPCILGVSPPVWKPDQSSNTHTVSLHSIILSNRISVLVILSYHSQTKNMVHTPTNQSTKGSIMINLSVMVNYPWSINHDQPIITN